MDAYKKAAAKVGWGRKERKGEKGKAKAKLKADLKDEEIDEPAPCPICGGDGFLLGVLGSLPHFRCRQCGVTFTTR